MKTQNKIIFLTLSVLVAVVAVMFKQKTETEIKPNPLVNQTATAASVISKTEVSETVPTTAVDEIQYFFNQHATKSDMEIKEQLRVIVKILQKSSHKAYVDFSSDELNEYNQLVREKVALQRILFDRKFKNKFRDI